MAHIQKAPAHAHESESKKNFELVNAVNGGGNDGELQSHAKHVDAANVVAAGSGKSGGLEIAGFPWQFVAILAVISLGVLTIVIRSIFGL